MPEIVSLYLPFALGLIATGLVSGVMAGLLGIGGGIIMVPAMVLAYQHRYDPAVIMHVAVGTSASSSPPGCAARIATGAAVTAITKRWGPWIVVASLIGGWGGLHGGGTQDHFRGWRCSSRSTCCRCSGS